MRGSGTLEVVDEPRRLCGGARYAKMPADYAQRGRVGQSLFVPQGRCWIGPRSPVRWAIAGQSCRGE